jgi:uncharacterized spore protein YtfJ
MSAMDVQTLFSQARDALTVKRVFGDPIERAGVTVIPVANVAGGAGGGRGTDQSGGGSGGGFGLRATPAGAYVIRDGDVTWQPAVNVNRAILGGQLVAIVALLTVREIVKARRRSAVEMPRLWRPQLPAQIRR